MSGYRRAVCSSQKQLLFCQLRDGYHKRIAGCGNENDIRTVYSLDVGKIVRIADEALEKVRGSAGDV